MILYAKSEDLCYFQDRYVKVYDEQNCALFLSGEMDHVSY